MKKIVLSIINDPMIDEADRLVVVDRIGTFNYMIIYDDEGRAVDIVNRKGKK